MIYVRLDYGYQFKSYVGEASEYIARYAVSAMACHIARHPISAANASNLFGFARKKRLFQYFGIHPKAILLGIDC